MYSSTWQWTGRQYGNSPKFEYPLPTTTLLCFLLVVKKCELTEIILWLGCSLNYSEIRAFHMDVECSNTVLTQSLIQLFQLSLNTNQHFSTVFRVSQKIPCTPTPRQSTKRDDIGWSSSWRGHLMWQNMHHGMTANILNYKLPKHEMKIPFLKTFQTNPGHICEKCTKAWSFFPLSHLIAFAKA